MNPSAPCSRPPPITKIRDRSRPPKPRFGWRSFACLFLAYALGPSGAFSQERLTFQVVSEAAHATDAFTQGFEIHNDHLYESAGLYGRSALRKIRLSDGSEVERIDLPSQFFAEGLTILGDRIYQLTWREQTAFVYDLDTLESVDTRSYSGEGWGLTNDGTRLYHSDGTPTIRVRNPETFEVVREIQVTENGAPIDNLNELEWVDDTIWANIWFSNRIVVIDPETGVVSGSLDLAPIASRHTNRFLGNVLNGIAVLPDNATVWITGKRWPKRYRIRIRALNEPKPQTRLQGWIHSPGEAAFRFPTYNHVLYQLETRSHLAATSPWRRTSAPPHVGDGFVGEFRARLAGAPTAYFRLRAE